MSSGLPLSVGSFTWQFSIATCLSTAWFIKGLKTSDGKKFQSELRWMRFSFKIVTSACGSDFSIFICDQAFFSFSGARKTADWQRKRKEGPPDDGYISFGDHKIVL